MPDTLKDIANKAGFSVTTVSRALGGYDDVSARTREHILKIAEELGYQPNHAARQLRNQRTDTLGIVMPVPAENNADDFFSLLLKGITYEAACNNYDVLVSAVHPQNSELDIYKRIIGGKRVDGVIVARTHRQDARIKYLQKMKYPFIVHGRLAPDEESNFAYIDVDSQQGIMMLTEYLIKHGFDKIGIILPPENIAYTPYRLAGYQEGLKKHDISFNESYCVYSDLSYQGGVEAAKTLLHKFPHLNAIIGCNDWMALGAQATAREMGYHTGDSFAVVGYDDIPASSHAEPSLTTIRQPIYKIGRELTNALIKIISQPTADLTQRLIQPELVIRNSSGRTG